jgi:perosamine synthetase
VNSIAHEVVRRLQKVLGTSRGKTPLHEPLFLGREKEYLCECVETGWVSSVGKFVDRFEADLAAFTGARRAVAMVNGTSALDLALRLAGAQAGEEVLVPALTFVGTANAVAHLNAVPHFIDSEAPTLGIDPEKLGEHLSAVAEMRDNRCMNRQTGRRIAAMAPVHVFGHPARMSELLEIARRYGLPVVEDAAESLGSTYKGIHTGLWGKMGVLSFNGNKTVTTGGGGAILCQDEQLAALAKHLSTTAKKPHPWAFDHDQVGFNYRMPNINAALGCAQLEQLPRFLERKRALAASYAKAFAGLDEVRFVLEPPGTRSNYWLCALELSRALENSLADVLAATNAAGFMTRPAWNLLSTLPMYGECPRADLSTAASLARQLINLPSGPALVPAT